MIATGDGVSECLPLCSSERKEKKANGEKVTEYSTSRVEKEFLKPRYITNIADNQHEGLFDGR
jgi:hypothetical protein